MIAIGCDHGGFALKQEIIRYLNDRGIEFKDFGTFSETSVNYAPIAAAVARSVAAGEYEKGILICGTGIGMSMAANKVKGIRAACCSDHFSARFTRLHNDANILCMGGRVVGPGVAVELVDLFLHTDLEGGRLAARIAEIAAIENGEL